MAKKKDIEIEIAKLEQQITDLAGSVRYGGGNRDLMERLDKLIDVLSAAAMEEEKEPDKIDELVKVLTTEVEEDETGLAMQEVARSFTGIAEMMKENTELLRETIDKLETVQGSLKGEVPTPRKPREPEQEKEGAEHPKKVTEKQEPKEVRRGMDILEEKIGAEGGMDLPKRTEKPQTGPETEMDLMGEMEEMPKEESLEDILSEAEKLGIDTGGIKSKGASGGAVLPYILGIVWIFFGVLEFLKPLEIPIVTTINDFLMEEMTGMLFSVFLIITGVPMILIGMQGTSEKNTKLFNILSYVTGILWMVVGVVILTFLMQDRVLEGMILLPVTGMSFASGLLSMFIGISMTQGKFSI
ncbi:MAG: DUF308 domain-containing protein [Euryarchaeota archaeon]|nr:DUF308 domain-containing protein [Euryarchaeota archaeon]